MQFTPEQAREMAELGPETLRHWRKAVPYLSAKKGKAARFTFAEIVGLAVLRHASGCFGIQVSFVSVAIDEMFVALCRYPTLNDNGLHIRLTTEEARVVDGRDLSSDECKPAILVPLSPIVEKLNQRILPTFTVAPQRAFSFPGGSIRRQA